MWNHVSKLLAHDVSTMTGWIIHREDMDKLMETYDEETTAFIYTCEQVCDHELEQRDDERLAKALEDAVERRRGRGFPGSKVRRVVFPLIVNDLFFVMFLDLLPLEQEKVRVRVRSLLVRGGTFVGGYYTDRKHTQPEAERMRHCLSWMVRELGPLLGMNQTTFEVDPGTAEQYIVRLMVIPVQTVVLLVVSGMEEKSFTSCDKLRAWLEKLELSHEECKRELTALEINMATGLRTRPIPRNAHELE